MTVDNSGLIASALYKTDPALYAAIDGGNTFKASILTRGARVGKYRRYEEGNHDAQITDQMRAMLRLMADDADLGDFCGNYCGIVVDKMAGRLKVSEVTTDDEAQDKWISWLLERNNWDAMQGIVYRGAIRDADSYVMVDPTTFKWTTEPAYDGFSGVFAIFPASGGWPLWACKIWSEAENQDLAEDETPMTAVMHIKVYQPNEITNWIGEVNGQEVSPGEAEEKQWPLGYVPVVHFANLSDNYTQYGKSELRKAIPLQNVYNRTLHSMVMASEFSAFKVAYSIGIEIDKSGITPGAVINLVVTDAAGKVVTDLTDAQIEFLKSVRVGEFDATDISQYTNQLAEIVKHMSQATQTPIYGVTAEGNLSGEALKQLEIGLIGKIRRFQNENTAAIRQLFQLSADIQQAFSYPGLEVQPPQSLDGISINWASPEITDVSATITSILAVREKAPGLFDDDFFRQKIGGLWGMTQAQIVAEGEKATNTQAQAFDQITGAAGNRPVVV